MTTSDHPTGYSSPQAMWNAVVSRSRNTAREAGSTSNNLARQFVYDRFLARLFTHAADGTWVLKGGTALLARVRSARHSRDIDLFRNAGTLDTAMDELRDAAALDLNDYLRFVLGDSKRSQERPGQPGSELATVKIDGYAGVRKVSDFSVDVVIGAVITSDPQLLRPEPTITLPGMESPPYRIYPVADHIADKLCATIERHGPAQLPSSRVRDLVDLVVIARTQQVSAGALREAITAERLHRGLPEITHWQCPSEWVKTYAKEARDVIMCRNHRSFDDASALAGTFLNPVLSGQVAEDSVWNPERLDWEG
ncbi:nucleotidyl transferase AbiEii/AbiGii toxin family protein [Pseudonocardia sp. RS010]|uniref:nucleotidyl transferase AbiEii/AbiGii toxin family protein n=1 Tax=Pseudonocardia sp. RS010 TaxID=3385979 RepID=UPI0039A3E0AB